MVFDYKAFAMNQEKLWADLQAFELLKGPFTAPKQTNASNIFEEILYIDFAEIEAKVAAAAFIDGIWEEAPPVQPAAPVLVGTRTKHKWQDMQDAYERRKHRR